MAIEHESFYAIVTHTLCIHYSWYFFKSTTRFKYLSIFAAAVGYFTGRLPRFKIFQRPNFKVELKHKIGNILKNGFSPAYSPGLGEPERQNKCFVYHHIDNHFSRHWSFSLCRKMQQYSVWVYVKCHMVLILLSGDILANLELFLETWPDGFQIMFYPYLNRIRADENFENLRVNGPFIF